MNVLPTGPFHQGRDLELYFRHMDRFHFDVAYIAYYAYGWARTTGEYRDAYIAFADEAHRRGYKACVQIQTVLALEEDVPITEAQYFSSGEPAALGPGVFMASYASVLWRDYVKKLARLFIRDYGYDWIVHEEPCWPVDVPGEQDPIYKLFREKYPGVRYPFNAEGTSLAAEQFRNNVRLLDRRRLAELRENHRRRMQSPEYEQVQQFKMDVLVDYFRDLASDAKRAGAKKFGVMPWIFTPTSENAPAVTMNACCHLGRIALIDDLDLLVVRMQPDNIFYHDDPFNGLIDEQGEAEPRLYYLETMAHHLSKQVIAVNNPVNERNFLVARSGEHSSPLPLDFYKRCTLAVMAANPNGMTRHWYDQTQFERPADLLEESTYAHNVFQAGLLPFMTRLGQPVASLGFVFSFEASNRADPWGRAESWRSYYRFASEMMYGRHIPMKTLYAGALRKNLGMHPELKTIVVCGQHPVRGDDARALIEWWQELEDRRLIYVGSFRAWREIWPQWLETADRVTPEQANGCLAITAVNKRGNSLYLIDADLREAPLEPVASFVCRALQECGGESWLKASSPDVLWSMNRSGYIAVSNTSPNAADITLTPRGNGRLFDVLRSCWEERDLRSIRMDGYDFGLWRVVDPRIPWLDIRGQVSIANIAQHADNGTVTFTIETCSRPVEVLVERLPTSARFNGNRAEPEAERAGGFTILRFSANPDAENQLCMQWQSSGR